MEGLTLKALLEGGIAIGAVTALIVIILLVIRHVLKSQERILAMATTQNEGWQRAISEHTTQAKEFHTSVQEAHRYQREEHKDIIEKTTNILANQAIIVKGNCDIVKTLERINEMRHTCPIEVSGEKGSRGEKGERGDRGMRGGV